MASSKFPNVKKRIPEGSSTQKSLDMDVQTSAKDESAESFTSEAVPSEEPSVSTETSEGSSTQKAANADLQNCSSQADASSESTEPHGSADTSSSTVSASLEQIPSVIDVSSFNRQKDYKTNQDDDVMTKEDKVLFVQNDILNTILNPQAAVPVNPHSAPAPSEKSKSPPLGKGESAIFCRICHEIGSTDLFISPCDCKGSLSVVHKRCLERWLAESNSDFCELCGFEYNVMRLAKRNVLASVFWWVVSPNNVRARRLLTFDLVSLSVLIPLAFLGTTLGMKAVAQELPNMTVLALSYTRFLQLALMAFALTLDIGILTWTVIRLQYHFSKWLEWHRKNCNVHLLGYPEPQTAPTIPVPHVSSTTVREIKF